MKRLQYIFTLLMTLVSINVFGQFVLGQVQSVSDVKAKIEVEDNTDLISISGFSENLTDGYKSLFYKLSVIKIDEKNNRSSDLQSGRFTLEANEKKMLSKVQLDTRSKSSTIVLLLIYDENQKLIAKDRYAFNEVKNNNLQKSPSKLSDGIEIKGLVSDETKTKFGKDFYDNFYTEYNKLKLDSAKLVVVEEEIANRTTRIRVKIDSETINEFLSKPDDEFLKAMAEDSASKTFNYLKKLEKQSNEIIKY